VAAQGRQDAGCPAELEGHRPPEPLRRGRLHGPGHHGPEAQRGGSAALPGRARAAGDGAHLGTDGGQPGPHPGNRGPHPGRNGPAGFRATSFGHHCLSAGPDLRHRPRRPGDRLEPIHGADDGGRGEGHARQGELRIRPAVLRGAKAAAHRPGPCARRVPRGPLRESAAVRGDAVRRKLHHRARQAEDLSFRHCGAALRLAGKSRRRHRIHPGHHGAKARRGGAALPRRHPRGRQLRGRAVPEVAFLGDGHPGGPGPAGHGHRREPRLPLREPVVGRGGPSHEPALRVGCGRHCPSDRQSRAPGFCHGEGGLRPLGRNDAAGRPPLRPRPGIPRKRARASGIPGYPFPRRRAVVSGRPVVGIHRVR